MAKRKESRYVFDASTKTIKFPGHVDLNEVLAIINVTSNQTIYALTENGKGGSVIHTHPEIGSDPDFPYSYEGVCVLTLDFDTTSMNDTDELLIFIEDERKGLRVSPHDLGLDPIERTRVSNPTSLIDADFEYGLQNTKWQSLGTNQNYSSFTDSANTYYAVTGVSSGGQAGFSTITVSMTGTLPAAGSSVYVSGTTTELAHGPFLVLTSGGGSFTYLAKGSITAGSILTSYTLVRSGTIFTGSALPITNIQTTSGNTSVTINFSTPHNLVPGSPITIYDSTAGTQVWEGSFYVNEVVSAVQVKYTVNSAPGTTSTVTTSTVYAQSASFFTHRPLDGGVVMGPFFPIHGLDAKRQTKRYFRYQSGKAIVFASGILFSPTFDILSVTYSAPDITITTSLVHGLQPGAEIILSGVDSENYNGTYTVNSIVSDTSFIVAAGGTAPTVTPAEISDTPKIVISKWCGSKVRSGIFDDANGLFWEYDGETLYAVRRTSTNQLVGTVSLTVNSHTVTGLNTRFTSQLKIGQFIQIRGRVYQISTITNDTTMSIAPEYTGNSNISNSTFCKITELRIPQSQFNFDTIDGSGPSGYNINITKMQMFGIQYSWYGAGYADFVLRTASGEYIICHRIVNNNINTEAYMRSGNLPARYEVKNIGVVDHLAVATGTTPTTGATLTLNDGTYFPDASATYPKYILLSNNFSGTTFHEVLSYTGKSGNQLTGVTRTSTMPIFLSGSTRNFIGTSTVRDYGIGSVVRLLSVTAAPTVSHWGSAVIIDGGFDDDTGYSFTHTVRGSSIAANTTTTLLLFRPAPSVSDNIPGAYGSRDTINRSQTKLVELEVNNRSDVNLEVIGVLNPSNFTNIPWANAFNARIGATSGFYQPCFAQVDDTISTAPTDGEIVFRFLASGADRFTYSLARVKEIQNSVLGGEGTYPNGPEVLAIVVRNNNGFTSTTVDINLKWEEAQA